jgi:adenine-specific DNA-methyltransferase
MADTLHEKGKSSAEILRHIATHVRGKDIDPVLCELSRQFLRMALAREIQEVGREPAFNISAGNALMEDAHRLGRADVVICNPPYRKMPRVEVDEYRSRYAGVIGGQPNLYGLFFQHAIELAKHEGLVGMLTPTSFLSGQYFSSLRTYLLAHTLSLQMDIVTEREGVFIGVEQETAISVLKRVPAQTVVPGETKVFIFERRTGFAPAGVCSLPNSGQVWPVPRSRTDATAIRSANGVVFRLDDYGYSARIGAFVDYRDPRATFATPPKKSKGRAVFPLIWSSDIGTDGKLELGRMRPRDGHHSYVDMQRIDHASVVRRPCVALQRVTSPDQPRRLVAASVAPSLLAEFGGIVGENHVVILEQVADAPKVTPTQLAALLSSEPVDRLFRCISGAVNVSVFELQQLPLPNPAQLKAELKASRNFDAAVARAYSGSRA